MNDGHRASDTGLLDEFHSWLSTVGDPFPDDSVANAAVFVGWHRSNSTRHLDMCDEDDIVEFLLDWCPRRATVPAEAAAGFCAVIGSFLEFLGNTGRLAGGSARGAGLCNLAVSLASSLETMAAEPDGNPKAILFHPGFNPPGEPRYVELLAQPEQMPEDQLEAELRSRMAEFKALPVDMQAAAVDRVFSEEPEPVELPFVYIPPPADEVESVAARAPMLAKIDALRDYLGEAGKPLTDRGNIKRADGKALIELLDTGDEMDPTFGDRSFRTSTTGRLPGLNSIVNIAKKAGAVRVHNRRLAPVKAWSRKSATDRATAVYNAIIELGALGARGRTYPVIDTIDEVLDSGIVHWLVRILDPGGAGDIDELVELTEPVLRDEIERYWPQWSSDIETTTRHGISRIFQMLDDAGVIEWTDRRQEIWASMPFPTGGTIRLTALGQYVVPNHLEEAGYVLRRIDDLADAPASVLIYTLDDVPDELRQQVADAWQPTLNVANRVGQIVDLLGSAVDPSLRLKTFAALELFAPETVGPTVRQLLDGPAAGHAALYLMSRGLADEAEVGELVNIGVFVDVLAASLDDPDELCEMFSEAPHSDDQYAALEQIWRHPSSLTAAVLDALGQHHPDRALAKAARKAAVKHRSWMANLN